MPLTVKTEKKREKKKKDRPSIAKRFVVVFFVTKSRLKVKS
jgi:hypothetical protein